MSATEATTTHAPHTARARPTGEPQTISGGHLVAEALRAERIRPPRAGRRACINVWIDPNAFAPGTMNQTMYK